jgi:type II secretory pathway pseudopilin PulG
MQSLHSRAPQNAESDAESGFVLLAVIFLTVVLLIALAVAAPKIALSIQRQKDIETVHRGEQYRRAIQLYYRQFGSYPTSVKQLLDTNNMRFLRRKYTDPLTGKDDWKPVYYGQAHVHPLGFFGQPLSATGIAGASAIMGSASSGMYAVSGTSTGGTSSSGFGSSDSSGFGSSDATATNDMGAAASPTSGSSMFGSSATSSMFGSSSTGLGATAGTTSPTGASSAFGGSSAGSGTDATTFTGSSRPIVGFSLPLNKASVVVFMKQTNYSHWEFNYDPIVDQLQPPSLLGGSGVGAGNAATADGFDNNSNGFGSGSSSGFGSSSTSPTSSAGGLGSTTSGSTTSGGNLFGSSQP